VSPQHNGSPQARALIQLLEQRDPEATVVVCDRELCAVRNDSPGPLCAFARVAVGEVTEDETPWVRALNDSPPTATPEAHLPDCSSAHHDPSRFPYAWRSSTLLVSIEEVVFLCPCSFTARFARYFYLRRSASFCLQRRRESSGAGCNSKS
jgi:hypothetical protein